MTQQETHPDVRADEIAEIATLDPPETPAWLGIAALLADAAFETDALGRFTAVGPTGVLGFTPAALLGTPAADLFSGPDGAFTMIFNAICTDALVWHGKILVKPAEGARSTFRLALAPKLDAAGAVIGTFGLLLDLGAPELSVIDSLDVPEFGVRTVTVLDAETGLWSAASFVEQAARRFDRLDVEEKPGTLIYLGFATAPVNLHAQTAIRLTEELREVIRPTDLLTRIDPTTIGLWCDGMDHLTAAERATRFCTHLPAALPGQVLISVGLATRWPGSGDDPQCMMDRTASALKEAGAVTKRESIGTWRVWQKEPGP
jgi:GGDEF domain-containing protein